MSARYIVGDVFEVLATLPDDSVDLVFGSPPFLALRSYLPADHPLKDREIGSEATPADFLDTLLDVVEACDRVLAPHGSLCFELGDTFAGSGGAGGDYTNENGLHEGQPVFRQTHSEAWPLPKSLALLPTLFAASLAYGRNLLRPERTTPRWRIRNVVVWARPNPPVGALGDKFRPATSYLTVACKSDKRWFDLDAVRTEPNPKYAQRRTAKDAIGVRNPDGSATIAEQAAYDDVQVRANPAGAPPLDYWEIPTQPYAAAHFATMASAVVVKPVKAMCPSKVCRVCGEPSRRITEASYESLENVDMNHAEAKRGSRSREMDVIASREQNAQAMEHGRATKHVETLGWTDCGCDIAAADDSDDCGLGDPIGRSSHRLPPRNNRWRSGVVLDPFAGSGTTLSVATGHGRDAIGIDLDESNAELALERVGPLFLTVETLEGTEPFAPPAEDVETEIV